MTEEAIKEHKNGVSISFKVSPGSSKTSIGDIVGGKVPLKIAAPPIEGKANKEVIRFLSKLFKIPKSDIEIISGKKSKNKIVLLKGVEFRDVKEKLILKNS